MHSAIAYSYGGPVPKQPLDHLPHPVLVRVLRWTHTLRLPLLFDHRKLAIGQLGERHILRTVRDNRLVHHVQLVTVLEDAVVRLDGHTADDLAVHLAGEDEETARRFGWWPAKSTEETVTHAFEEWAQDWIQQRPRRTFAVRRQQDRHLVGGCQLRMRPDLVGEVSYWTNASERRRGYASRALRLLIGYAGVLDLIRLEALIACDNIASRRVAVAAGFTELAIVVEDDQEMVRYGLNMAGSGRA